MQQEEAAVSEPSLATLGQQHRILGASTLAVTVYFAIWTFFSIINVQIKQDLGLNDTEFGLLVAIPILTESLSRIFLGIWTDHDERSDPRLDLLLWLARHWSGCTSPSGAWSGRTCPS